MAIRTKVNSSTLRKNHPMYYRDLFSKCQIVVSSADSFFWAGEYARFFGGLSILQKLPTKNLVGLEVISDEKICFADELKGYSPSHQSFTTVSFDSAKEKRLLNFIEAYWPTLDPSRKIKGFKIHILSESHCGGGLGSTGVVLACLANCLFLLAKKLTPKELNSWQHSNVDKLLKSAEHKKFREVFRLAWRLTAICRDGNASGATSFGAFLYTPYPIVHFSKDINNYLQYPSIANPPTVLDNCRIIEEIPFWGNTFNNIFPLKMPIPWPIDIGRVYSGTLVNTENILKSFSSIKLSMEELQEAVRKHLYPKVDNKDISMEELFGFEAKQTQIFSHQDFIDVLNIVALKLLVGLKNLFTLGPNKDSLQEFSEAVNQSHDFCHFLGHSNNLLDEISQIMARIVARENEFGISGAKIEGIGKGGHSLFIGPTGTIPDSIVDEISVIAKSKKKNIYLDWASWLDGFGESGLMIEQFLNEKIYSDFIMPQSYSLKIFNDGDFGTEIIDSQAIEKRAMDFDMLLFVPHQKIYLKNKILSSKEIPSARATIKIFSKILANKDHKLSNQVFNDTSYGQSRYDLHSKIIIPLNKAMKKYLKKDLKFQITGGMYDNYWLSLNCKDLKVAIVEEMT